MSDLINFTSRISPHVKKISSTKKQNRDMNQKKFAADLYEILDNEEKDENSQRPPFQDMNTKQNKKNVKIHAKESQKPKRTVTAYQLILPFGADEEDHQINIQI
ncbi:MAG: hypothetical protein A2161_10800 [Candidatus Schekmanbacteria bacterium RBG_13_48_7]|uniref:Uncharacterized protein n=1 Tax=Candidatus Schekmanbacteria bacterium RBG_13_48_7 TaxID=1817878 RepID=A0A1F7RR66_9BACT|nr:MAG: hypothetical protein A2161_10800 [Candidatus Schekmanbacteria bacterium RBG_13_48_7]